ncbi:MAG: hypothetical protein M9927_16940 [Anaerolineae bacterium]|nr:hypothetical protein [Anaerolineae bacterium]
MAGRAPAGVTILAQQAAPGTELACRAQEHDFVQSEISVRRGVVSFYATEALLSAKTMGEWLAAIQRLVTQDRQAGRLPVFVEPTLTLLGNSDIPAP